MKKTYPFTLDKPLKKALFIAFAANDKVMIKKLWDLFLFYRREKNVGPK